MTIEEAIAQGWQPAVIKSLEALQAHADSCVGGRSYVASPETANKRILVREVNNRCPICGEPGCEVEMESALAACADWNINPLICKAVINVD